MYCYDGARRVLIQRWRLSTTKFTGKERDAESGLDNFGARYFTSSMGRFMTPDWGTRPTAVPYAVFGDPQSLNLYTYVRNDPVSHADLDGHCQSGHFWCDVWTGAKAAIVNPFIGVANTHDPTTCVTGACSGLGTGKKPHIEPVKLKNTTQKLAYAGRAGPALTRYESLRNRLPQASWFSKPGHLCCLHQEAFLTRAGWLWFIKTLYQGKERG